jgi:hypothetical protein
MATVATRREKKTYVPDKEQRTHLEHRIHLTPTGLLMEGDSTSLRCLFALIGSTVLAVAALGVVFEAHNVHPLPFGRLRVVSPKHRS